MAGRVGVECGARRGWGVVGGVSGRAWVSGWMGGGCGVLVVGVSKTFETP